ncbi:MAG TPA: hypothetical protein VF576_09350, partial [Rubricoccaceae bacterium]
ARLASEQSTEQACNPAPTPTPGTPTPTVTPTTPPPPAAPAPALGTTNGPGCACQGNKKVSVMHRPPGNESNEHQICISVNAEPAHIGKHNDYVVCRGS